MIDTKIIDEVSKHLSDALPEGARVLKKDFEKNARAIFESSLSKLEIVTRKEMDIQQGVLERTRAKLEVLEKRVAELEKIMGQANN